MPAFMPAQHVYPSNELPPQYLQPKYDGPLDFHNSYHALHPDADLDPYNHNKHASSGPMYNTFGAYYNDPMSIPFQVGAPTIQSLQIDSRFTAHHHGRSGQQQYQHLGYGQQAPEDEKIVGGVSARLDYDMEQMTDFVMEMSVATVKAYGYDKITFRKWVSQVLNATRLPAATIILSLSYLALRVNGLTAKKQYYPTERALYSMLTVALILGSKFLDDNTFQNKSWAEVSNITIKELNQDEMEWLAAFEHRLHLDPSIPDGFASWEGKWNSYKTKPMPMTTLLSVDTNMRGPRPARQSISPAGFNNRQYPVGAMSAISLDPGYGQDHYTSTYSPYQDLSLGYGQRSSLNRSPSTAPHTGPNTPDYYAAPSRWGPGPFHSSRDARYSYSSLPQPMADMDLYQSAYDAALYGYAPSMWNCHGTSCQCSNCRQPRYGPVMAA